MTQRLERQNVAELLDAVSAKTPTPGGGAVASIVGAMAGALAQMAINYSIGKKKLADHQPALREALAECQHARAEFLQLAQEDAAAYAIVNELTKLPTDDARRRAELPAAATRATQAPMLTAGRANALLKLFDALAPKTNPFLKSDLAIAAILAAGAVRASAQNVRVNLPMLREVGEEQQADKLAVQIDAMVAAAGELESKIVAACS